MTLARVSLGVLLATTAVAPALAGPARAPAEQACSTQAVCAVPPRWQVTRKGGLSRFAPPEADAHLTVVDISGARDARAAAAAALRLDDPAFRRPVKLVADEAARNGWKSAQMVEYEVALGEAVTARALALRSEKGWTVLLIQGSDATLQKRGAAVALVEQSLRPAAFRPERLAGRPPHRLDAGRIEAMKRFVQDSMQSLGVPGASLALIDHGQVVYEGGFGFKDLARRTPVDAHTRFMIASNTKGMTTLLLAKLVDEGKLAWDEPVVKVYPAFRLGDSETTARVRVRDLVCACTGLPRHDFEMIFGTRRDTPASTTFDLLSRTQPTSGFGEVYQYNNLMASAAGYIAGHLLYPDLDFKQAYDQAMQTRVFDPLEMTETTFDMSAGVGGDSALPYGHDIDGRPSPVGMDFNWVGEPYHPGGAAWSTAHDMAKYVRNELELGRLPNGGRVVSEANLLARRAPRVSMGRDATYGMGLMVSTEGGVPLIHHGGSMGGYKSDWAALPQAGIGAVLLTNSDDGVWMLRPFARRLLELVYDARPQAANEVAAAAARLKGEIAAERPRLVAPPEPGLTSRLAPRYANAKLGTITVRREGADVVFDFGLWRSRMASQVVDGRAAFVTIDPADSAFTFVLDENGTPGSLTLHDQQHAYVYRPAA